MKKYIIIIVILFLSGCNTASFVATKEYNKKITPINITLDHINILNSDIRMYRGDMKGLIPSILEALFQPGIYTSDDAKALENTVKYAIKKNHLFKNLEGRNLKLKVQIKYFYMNIGEGLPNSKFLSTINCAVIDKEKNIIHNFEFTMFYKQFFYLTIGSLKSNVNAAITYRIVAELLNKFGSTDLDISKHDNAQYFENYNVAEDVYEKTAF